MIALLAPQPYWPTAAPRAPATSRILALEQIVGWLGEPYRAEPPAAALLESALHAVEDGRLQLHPDQFAIYGEHMLAIAASEITNIPTDPAEAVRYAVLGTVLFEPVLTAIRRLGQQSLVKRRPDA